MGKGTFVKVLGDLFMLELIVFYLLCWYNVLYVGIICFVCW